MPYFRSRKAFPCENLSIPDYRIRNPQGKYCRRAAPTEDFSGRKGRPRLFPGKFFAVSFCDLRKFFQAATVQEPREKTFPGIFFGSGDGTLRLCDRTIAENFHDAGFLGDHLGERHSGE